MRQALLATKRLLGIYREVLHRQGVAAFDLDRIRYLWWSVSRLRSPWSEWDSRLLSLLAQISTEFAIYPEVRLLSPNTT